MEGATPSFADNEGQIVEAGSQVRLRIKGIRSELNQMYAIGSIREDYLGYVEATHLENIALDTNRRPVPSCSSDNPHLKAIPFFVSRAQQRHEPLLLIVFCNSGVSPIMDFSEALETSGQSGKKELKGAMDKLHFSFMFACPNQDTQSEEESSPSRHPSVCCAFRYMRSLKKMLMVCDHGCRICSCV